MSEPTEADYARWAKWEDLRRRKKACRTDEERTALAVEEEELELVSMKEMLRQDMAVEPSWMWLSFADASLPEGKQFLGVAIVEGGGIAEATLNAKLAKCNPGGEVLAFVISPENLPPEGLRYRLLSEQELRDAGLIE